MSGVSRPGAARATDAKKSGVRERRTTRADRSTHAAPLYSNPFATFARSAPLREPRTTLSHSTTRPSVQSRSHADFARALPRGGGLRRRGWYDLAAHPVDEAPARFVRGSGRRDDKAGLAGMKESGSASRSAPVRNPWNVYPINGTPLTRRAGYAATRTRLPRPDVLSPYPGHRRASRHETL